MPHIEQRVVLARTPDEIWAFTLNGFNSPRWFRGMLGARWMSGAPPGPDATFQARMIVLGLETRLECHVTEWQPARALGYTIKGRPFRSAFRRVTLVPTQGGTEFRAVTESSSGSRSSRSGRSWLRSCAVTGTPTRDGSGTSWRPNRARPEGLLGD